MIHCHFTTTAELEKAENALFAPCIFEQRSQLGVSILTASSSKISYNARLLFHFIIRLLVFIVIALQCRLRQPLRLLSELLGHLLMPTLRRTV